MSTSQHTLRTTMNRLVLPCGAFGLALIALNNWRLWQRDWAMLAQHQTAPAIPALEHWPALPPVSVLVAAWNEAVQIEEHIESFAALGYPHKQLVLCAGGADSTYDLARRYANDDIIVLEQHLGEGKQRALARCLTQANGKIIYLTDADCVLSDDALLAVLAPLAWGIAHVVTGRSEPKLTQRANPLVQYQWFIDLAWAANLPPVVDGVLGRNCALQRDVLDQIGGFSAPALTGTDYVMSRRLTKARYPIHIVVESRIATEYPDDARAYLRMWRRWNKNLLLHGMHFKAWSDVRSVLVACVLYTTIALLPLLMPLVGVAAGVVAFILFSIASMRRVRNVVTGARLAGRRVNTQLIARTFSYTCLDMLAVLLSVHDALRPQLRSRW